MKTIAVITGASSGMGRRFAETVSEYGNFDEVWVIARRAERLETLSCPFPKKVLPLDLTDRASFRTYADLLKQEQPRIRLLVNASGFGVFQSVMDTELSVNLNMADLDCQAVQAMCQLSVPYMEKNSDIINIASVAAFQPIPYINVYAACKAFVLSYSRALNRELRGAGIHVMALCPFWTKTEFFNRAVDDAKPVVVKKYVAMYQAEDIVKRAWRDVKRGKDVSMYGFKARGQALLVKLLPHSFVMNTWMNQQDLK